jgi:ADP-ribose pyrophosphatase YjhB (NUDIX family)
VSNVPGDSGDPLPSQADLLHWSESIGAIARTGLGFTENTYERERYEEIIKVAAEIGAAATGDVEPADLSQQWLSQVGSGVAGYVTPKVAVGAVVGNDDGELLLIQRADSGIWLYPTGWADIGYSAAEVAEKEVGEETGIECEVERVLAVYDGLRLGFHHVPLYSIVFHCRAVGGELKPHPLEVTDLGWFRPDNLPEPIANPNLWLDLAFRAVAGEAVEVHYDTPRQRPL